MSCERFTTTRSFSRSHRVYIVKGRAGRSWNLRRVPMGRNCIANWMRGFGRCGLCLGMWRIRVGEAGGFWAAGGILGSIKSMARGEIKEFSDVFNMTRHLALQRITSEAAAAGANAVVG